MSLKKHNHTESVKHKEVKKKHKTKDTVRGCVMVADNASVSSCPVSGIHHSTPSSDGCLHRLIVGCNSTSAIIIDSSCTRQRQ